MSLCLALTYKIIQIMLKRHVFLFVPNLRDIHVVCPRIVNGKRQWGSLFERRIGKKALSDSEQEEVFKICSG